MGGREGLSLRSAGQGRASDDAFIRPRFFGEAAASDTLFKHWAVGQFEKEIAS